MILITMATSTQTDMLTGPAPIESGVSREHGWTHSIVKEMKDCDASLDTILATNMNGCGQVHLIEMHISCQGMKIGDSVEVGTCAVGSTATLGHLSMMPNGFAYVTNAMTVGNKTTDKVIPLDNVSRQIRPISADLPSTKLMLKKTGSMRVFITFNILVKGIIVVYDSLN